MLENVNLFLGTAMFNKQTIYFNLLINGHIIKKIEVENADKTLKQQAEQALQQHFDGLYIEAKTFECPF